MLELEKQIEAEFVTQSAGISSWTKNFGWTQQRFVIIFKNTSRYLRLIRLNILKNTICETKPRYHKRIKAPTDSINKK